MRKFSPNFSLIFLIRGNFLPTFSLFSSSEEIFSQLFLDFPHQRKFSPNFSLIFLIRGNFLPTFSLFSSYQTLTRGNFPPTFSWFSSFQILYVGNFLPTFPWFSSSLCHLWIHFLGWQVVLYLLCLSVSAPRTTPTLSHEFRRMACREYWIIDRGPGFRMIWLLPHPLPLSRQ